MDKTNKWIQNRSNKIVIKNHDMSHQWTALKSSRNTFSSRNFPKRKPGDWLFVSSSVFLKECFSQDGGTYCCSRLINCCNCRVLWYLLRGSEFSLVKALQINVSCKLHCNAEMMGSIPLWFRVSLTVLLWRNGEFSLFSSFNDEFLLPIFFLFSLAQGFRNYHHWDLSKSNCFPRQNEYWNFLPT